MELLLAPGGAVPASHTLQRTRLLLNGAPAEIVRVQLYEADGRAGAIEDVALIEGGDGLFYSIALRCAPQDFARLEPLFQQSANSWHIEAAATAAGGPSVGPYPSVPAQPKPDSGKK